MTTELFCPTHNTYRIGAVSRLTGVTPDLIRVWERRYAVVKPMRSDTGTRLYTQDDIARLALIKHLVDAGDTISTVASLNVTELEHRLSMIGKHDLPQFRQQDALRVAVVGQAITAHITRHRRQFGNLELVGSFHDTHHLNQQPEACSVDVVVVEVPYVDGATSAEVEQLIDRTGAAGAVVVYGFGSRPYLGRLQMLPVVTLRAPTDVAELKRACLSASARGTPSTSELLPCNPANPAPIAPRRYDDDNLARIATLATTIECECPHQLADLVFSLVAFEQYSAACASRNEEDATMHRYLHATAANARAQLETALARLVEFEGLQV